MLILLWGMASIHPSEATLTAMMATLPHVVLASLPPRKHVVPAAPATWPSSAGFKSCIQAQASANLACSVFDGSFDELIMNKAWRRQSSAEWAAREVKRPLRQEPGVPGG